MLDHAARRGALLVPLVVLAAAVTGGCGTRPSASAGEPVVLAAPATPALPPPAVTTTRPAAQPAPWADPGAAAARVEPNTTLAAVVLDRVTGDRPVSIGAGRQFRSASLVKMLIAIDVLGRAPAAPTRERVARMLSASDDGIASSLWVAYGPGIVARTAKRLGLRDTAAPEQAGRWGETMISANDVVRVYRYVLDELPAADRALVVDALARAPRYAADGFDQFFGIPDGLGVPWAVKQGWGNNEHAMVLHSTGLVGADRRYVVVLLTEHPLGALPGA
jgi:hypothetical protein